MNVSVKAKIGELGYNIDELDADIQKVFVNSVGQLASAAREEWVRLAQHRLNTSRDSYINGLRQSESFKILEKDGSKEFHIQLVGAMPNNFEFGMESFDMKSIRPGWLGGGKARTAKDGHKYNIIPLRHSTTSKDRIGYSGKAKAAGLQEELKKTVKDYGMNRMVRLAGGAVKEGAVSRVPKSAPVHPYLKGLTRIQTATAGTTKSGLQKGSGQLMTFRIISEKSPEGSWQHPGIKPANLMAEVEAYIDREMSAIAEKIMGDAS